MSHYRRLPVFHCSETFKWKESLCTPMSRKSVSDCVWVSDISHTLVRTGPVTLYSSLLINGIWCLVSDSLHSRALDQTELTPVSIYSALKKKKKNTFIGSLSRILIHVMWSFCSSDSGLCTDLSNSLSVRLYPPVSLMDEGIRTYFP